MAAAEEAEHRREATRRAEVATASRARAATPEKRGEGIKPSHILGEKPAPVKSAPSSDRKLARGAEAQKPQKMPQPASARRKVAQEVAAQLEVATQQVSSAKLVFGCVWVFVLGLCAWTVAARVCLRRRNRGTKRGGIPTHV